MVVSLLGAAHATCSPRGCKASEYVALDAEDEPPARRERRRGAASGFDSITHPFVACDVSAMRHRHARRHSVSTVE